MLLRSTASLWQRCCRPHVTLFCALESRHTQLARRLLLTHTAYQVRRPHSSAASPSTSTTPQRPCIVVIGGGAIGLLFTALLTLTLHSPRVLVISRSLSARPLTAPAVRVELLPATVARLAAADTAASAAASTSPFTVPSSSIFSSAAALLSSPSAPAAIRAVLITTKGLPALSTAIFDAQHLSHHATSHHSPPPLIVPVMNGIAHLSQLPRHFSAGRLVYATTSQGAHWAASDVVRQAGSGATTLVLPAAEGDSHEWLGWLCELMCSAAMDVRVASADELLCVHWSKLLVNCVVNPLTALINVRNGWLEQWLTQDAAAHKLVRHITQEVLQVGQRHGVTFAFQPVDQTNSGGGVSEAAVDAAVVSVLAVVRATAGNVSSMASDVRAGRVTEVDGMNGELVRLGERYGVDTPYNRALWELVRELQPAGG